jgi:hypothetical protein
MSRYVQKEAPVKFLLRYLDFLHQKLTGALRNCARCVTNLIDEFWAGFDGLDQTRRVKEREMAIVDRQLLDAAGINISKAADILKKSRQTVSRGIANASAKYFRMQDVHLLYRHVEETNSDLIPIVQRFIKDHYADYAKITDSFGRESLLEYLSSQEVWFFFPTLSVLQFEFPNSFEQVKQFISKYDGQLNIVLKDEPSAHDVTKELDSVKASCRIILHHSEIVSFYPITFFFSFQDKKKVLVLVSDVLSAVDPVQSRRMYHGMINSKMIRMIRKFSGT